MKTYKVIIATGGYYCGTGETETFDIDAENLSDAQALAIDETIHREYDYNDIVDVVEKEPEGKETKKISKIEDICWFFYQTPEIITGDMMKKIESGTMWLVIEINHDNKTASYFFEENNNAHMSIVDNYDGVLEFFEEIEQESTT